MSGADAIERDILRAIDADGVVNTARAAERLGVDPQATVGTMKRLSAANMVVSTAIDRSKFTLTKEGESCVELGSPEARAFARVPAEGVDLATFKATAGAGVADVGFKQAMQCKWLAMVKGETPRVERKVDSIVDVVRETLARVKAGEPVDAKTLEPLVKKRKLVREEKWKEYELTKGPEFALERKVLPADLTKEMMNEGTWKGQAFKAYNLVQGRGRSRRADTCTRFSRFDRRFAKFSSRWDSRRCRRITSSRVVSGTLTRSFSRSNTRREMRTIRFL